MTIESPHSVELILGSDHKPQNITIISIKKSKIVKEHHEFLSCFKENNRMLYLTVKELREKWEERVKKAKPNDVIKQKSLKTIYRWLQDLNKEDIIIEAGTKRTTNGSGRVKRESVYCLAAELIFIADKPKEKRYWNDEKIKFADHLNNLLSSFLDVDKFPDTIMDTFVEIFYDKHDNIVDEIVMKAERDGKVMSTYRQIKNCAGDININQINSTAAFLSIILKEPQILQPLRDYLNKDI